MKNKFIYSTSQLSRFYDLTPKGLAYYEKQGLIHPERKEESSYRIFQLNDCYSLYHSKFYKNSGLSLKEMVDLEKGGSLHEVIQSLNSSSAKELEKIRIEERILERVQEITGLLNDFMENGPTYKLTDRPDSYRLFVRNFDFHHVSDEKSAEEFAKWNSYIPINTASLLYKKEKVLSNDSEMNVNIANIISAKDLDFLGLEKSDLVIHYPSCRCIETIISGKSNGIDSSDWLKKPLQYLKENGYILNGDILTSMLLVTGEKDNRTRYDLAWFPIDDSEN